MRYNGDMMRLILDEVQPLQFLFYIKIDVSIINGLKEANRATPICRLYQADNTSNTIRKWSIPFVFAWPDFPWRSHTPYPFLHGTKPAPLVFLAWHLRFDCMGLKLLHRRANAGRNLIRAQQIPTVHKIDRICGCSDSKYGITRFDLGFAFGLPISVWQNEVGNFDTAFWDWDFRIWDRLGFKNFESGQSWVCLKIDPKFPSPWNLTASSRTEHCLGLPEPLWCGEELSGGTLRGPCRLERFLVVNVKVSLQRPCRKPERLSGEAEPQPFVKLGPRLGRGTRHGVMW